MKTSQLELQSSSWLKTNIPRSSYPYGHHTYPILHRSSTPCTMKSKTSRLELLFLHKEWPKPIQTRRISPIVCSLDSSKEEGYVPVSSSWIETYIPMSARPYAYLMRWHQYRATLLICMPCLWSIAFTTVPGNNVDVKILALFTLVGSISHGIGCTINDILDREFDAKVERTKLRPLASGELTLLQGFLCLGLQMCLCYSFLLQVNVISRKLWLVYMVLAFTYPLMKRVTFWPQAYLGLTINFLNLSGWAAVKGGLDLRILLPLCTSGIFWTLIYDTIYSHQDKKDDAKIGVKSLGLLLGDSTKIWMCGFAAACIGGLALTGSLASIGWQYYASLAAASSHFVWQIGTVNLDSPTDCSTKKIRFQSPTWCNRIIWDSDGKIIFLMLLCTLYWWNIVKSL